MGTSLTSAPELLRRLAAGEPLTLLDVRWELATGPGHADYARGHIPGAVFIDLDRALAAPAGAGGRHPLPEPTVFGAAMRAAGVSAGRAVVVYDAATAMAAARAWWLLRYFGHPDVAVLDGGLAAWLAAGGALATGTESVAGGDFTARPGGMPVLSATAAAELARTGILLDARAPERFRGETEPIDPVAGHIPGARNRPSTENLTGAGTFRDPQAIRAGLAGLAAGGVDAGGSVRIGAYCGSGVTAAHTVLALELAGVAAALYPGSWSEWIADPSRPVATGE